MRHIELHFSRPLQRAVFLFGVACILAVNSYSQKASAKDDPFTKLLAKVQAGDTSIDFKSLRLASVDSKSDAAGEVDPVSRQKLLGAYKAGKFDETIAFGEQVLDGAYVNLEVHLLVGAAYRERGNQKKFEFHRAVYLGLLNSIMDGADGKSAKTAYVVIGVYEEYAVLRALDLVLKSQTVNDEGGHKYDVLTAADPKTKATRDVWFNIDIVWAGYNKIFK